MEIHFKRLHKLRDRFLTGRVLEGCVKSINTHNPDDAVSQLFGSLYRYRPTHGMPDQNNFAGINPVYDSRHVLAESLHGVTLPAAARLTVAGQIQPDNLVSLREIVKLRVPEGMVARPAMDEDDHRLTLPPRTVHNRAAIG